MKNQLRTRTCAIPLEERGEFRSNKLSPFMKLIGWDLWNSLQRDSERYVLAFHIYHADKTGQHTHTYQQIADKIGYTRKIVIEACQRLVALGYLTKIHNRINRYRSTANTFWITEKCYQFLEGLDSFMGNLRDKVNVTPCSNDSDLSILVSTSTNTCTQKNGPDALKNAHQENDKALHEVRLDKNPGLKKNSALPARNKPDVWVEQGGAHARPLSVTAPIVFERDRFARMVRLWPLYGDFEAPSTSHELLVALERLRSEKLRGFNPWKWRQQVGRLQTVAYEALVQVLILTSGRILPTDQPVEEVRNPAAYLGGILYKPVKDANPGDTLQKFDDGLRQYAGNNDDKFDLENVGEGGRAVIESLQNQLSPEILKSWFIGHRYQLVGQDFVIFGKSEFTEHWLSTRYLPELKHAVEKAYGTQVRLKFGRLGYA